MAAPFIDTVELETVALNVAVNPAVGNAVAGLQLLLTFQFPFVVPVHVALAAKHAEEDAATSRMGRKKDFFMV
jgi:hypothetical protein